MKATLSYFLFFFLFAIACTGPAEENVPQIGFSDLEALLNSDNDTVYVINFWATWCKPCIEELPAFEKLKKEYRGNRVEIILVSLDFPTKYESQLVPFVKENKLECKVVHLTDVNANQWIDRVDPSWSGAIPATVVYNGKDRSFFEKKLSFEELKSIVENKL